MQSLGSDDQQFLLRADHHQDTTTGSGNTLRGEECPNLTINKKTLLIGTHCKLCFLHLLFIFFNFLRRNILFIVPIVQCKRIKKSNLNALCFYSASALKEVDDCTNCIKREEAPCSSSIVLGPGTFDDPSASHHFIFCSLPPFFVIKAQRTRPV